MLNIIARCKTFEWLLSKLRGAKKETPTTQELANEIKQRTAHLQDQDSPGLEVTR
jgi:hypothetical protein